MPSFAGSIEAGSSFARETSVPAFSRTIRRLTDAGLIGQDDAGQIRLVDREKLRLVAEGLFPEI